MASYRSNGYIPSILQDSESCFLCGRQDRKLDRHEVFNGAFRTKSKGDGLWVLLCHTPCHEGPDGVHGRRELREDLRAYAQGKAMEVYGWSKEEFIQRYGKNYL